MTSVAEIDKLKHEIHELSRQQREVNERLNVARRRGRGGFSRGGRGGGRAGNRRKAEEEPEGPRKKQKLSSVVVNEQEEQDEQNPRYQRGRNRRFQNQDPTPRVIPPVDDPNLEKRNRRMFGALLGTLEKFRQEEKQLSSSEALIRRSESMKMAEQRAVEQSTRLLQEQREHYTESKKRDLILRARLHSKAEEKHYQLLYLQWSEHRKRLSTQLKTKTEPRILYLPAKRTEADEQELEENKKEYEEWKVTRKAELDEYVKQISEASMAKAEADVERVINSTNRRNAPETKEGEEDGDAEERDGRRDRNRDEQEDHEQRDDHPEQEQEPDQEHEGAAAGDDAMEDEDDYREPDPK